MANRQAPQDPLLVWEKSNLTNNPPATATAVRSAHGQSAKPMQSSTAQHMSMEEKPHKKVVPWTVEEDESLLSIIGNQCGALCWSEIAKHLITVRTGKQCRERYLNHLMPGIDKSPFTAEEDALLLSLYAEQGSRWRAFTQRLPGRSDNAIKNRFNALKHKWKHREKEREKQLSREQQARRKNALKSKRETSTATAAAPAGLRVVSQSPSTSVCDSSFSLSPSLSLSLSRSLSQDDNYVHPSTQDFRALPRGHAGSTTRKDPRFLSIPEEDAMDIENDTQSDRERERERTAMDIESDPDAHTPSERLFLTDEHVAGGARDPLEALLSLPEEDWERLQSSLSTERDAERGRETAGRNVSFRSLPLLSPLLSVQERDRWQRLCRAQQATDAPPDLIWTEYPLTPSLSSLSPRLNESLSTPSLSSLSSAFAFTPVSIARHRSAINTIEVAPRGGGGVPPLLSAISPFTPFNAQGWPAFSPAPPRPAVSQSQSQSQPQPQSQSQSTDVPRPRAVLQPRSRKQIYFSLSQPDEKDGGHSSDEEERRSTRNTASKKWTRSVSFAAKNKNEF